MVASCFEAVLTCSSSFAVSKQEDPWLQFSTIDFINFNLRLQFFSDRFYKFHVQRAVLSMNAF